MGGAFYGISAESKSTFPLLFQSLRSQKNQLDSSETHLDDAEILQFAHWVCVSGSNSHTWEATELGTVGFVPVLSAVWRYWVAIRVLAASCHFGGLQLVGINGELLSEFLIVQRCCFTQLEVKPLSYLIHFFFQRKTTKCHFFVFF